MGLFSGIADAIGNVIESSVKAVGDTVNVVTTTIDGGSTKDALADLSKSGSKFYSGSLDVASLGQGDKLDTVSGGLFSAAKNIGNTGSNLIEGKSVRQNLEDAARVGAVVASGGTWGVAAGMGVNAGLTGKDGKSNISLKNLASATSKAGTGYSFLDNILGAVGATPTTPRNSGNVQSGYYSDTPSEIYQSADKNLVIPLVIGILLISIVIIKKH